MTDGTQKIVRLTQGKTTKDHVQVKRLPKSMQPHRWWTNMFVPEAKLRKISYFHLQIHILDQQK
jgi:hypothetical protein